MWHPAHERCSAVVGALDEQATRARGAEWFDESADNLTGHGKLHRAQRKLHHRVLPTTYHPPCCLDCLLMAYYTIPGVLVSLDGMRLGPPLLPDRNIQAVAAPLGAQDPGAMLAV